MSPLLPVNDGAESEFGTASFNAVDSVPLSITTENRDASRRWTGDGAVLAADLLALAAAVPVSGFPVAVAAGCAGLTTAIFAGLGLYRSRIARSFLDDLPRLIVGVSTGIAFTFLLAGLVQGGQAPAFPFAQAFAASAVAVLAGRAVAYAVLRSIRQRQGRRTLIVGTGMIADRIGRILLEHSEYGMNPVGFACTSPMPTATPIPVLGSTRELAAIVCEHRIQDVIVAFSDEPESELIELLQTFGPAGSARIFVVPRLFEVHPRAAGADEIQGVPLVRIRQAAYGGLTWKLKRLLDVCAAATALLLLSPVLAACALAVRLECGPGVVFRQERTGMGGRRFTILKFRSLIPTSAAEADTRWNVANEARIGRVGRFLRSTSLDELPQLVNILRGDMSLVGPRPERPYFVEQFQACYDRYADRHRVPIGLTGWAQVHGLRGDTSIADRVWLDNHYIENWSLWLDLKIILRTVSTVVRRAGR